MHDHKLSDCVKEIRLSCTNFCLTFHFFGVVEGKLFLGKAMIRA